MMHSGNKVESLHLSSLRKQKRTFMSIKKRFLKSKPVCKVTFRLPKKAAGRAETVHLVGDFNNWETSATPMKKLKSGAFSTTLDLEVGREYQFRYLIDETDWENDGEADKYVPSSYPDVENSVVVV
jgi:1,4-alpha-glucan branching enzyme